MSHREQLLDDPDDLAGLDDLARPAPPRTWRERVVHLADATGTTPGRIAAGAAALAVALVVGLWLTRPAATPPEVSLPFASTDPAGAGPATSASASSRLGTSTSAATEVVVDVAGAVAHPGVLHLPAGSRVIDAIGAAGGAAATADQARLNLAAPLTDGQRVYVPTVGEAVPAAVGPAGPGDAGATEPTGPVDLNTADEAALDALPGVGPATAHAIVLHRQEIGRYTSVDQLLDVRGIGTAKLEQLRPLVTV